MFQFFVLTLSASFLLLMNIFKGDPKMIIILFPLPKLRVLILILRKRKKIFEKNYERIIFLVFLVLEYLGGTVASFGYIVLRDPKFTGISILVICLFIFVESLIKFCINDKVKIQKFN